MQRRLTLELQRLSEDLSFEDMYEEGVLQKMELIQRAHVGNLIHTRNEAQSSNQQQVGGGGGEEVGGEEGGYLGGRVEQEDGRARETREGKEWEERGWKAEESVGRR